MVRLNYYELNGCLYTLI